MKKSNKIKLSLILLFIVVIIIPLITNISMFLPFSISSKSLSQGDWLSFWGSYLGGVVGGIGTLLAVFLTINYYESENLKAKKKVYTSYEISKIDKVINFIQNRDVIPSSDFEYNPNLSHIKDEIKFYNSLSSDFLAYFTDITIGIFISLFFIENNEGEPVDNNLSNFLSLPLEIREYSFIVGKLALYENCSELIKGHPQIGHIIEKEAGGSYGMWHLHLHNFCDDEYRETQFKDYLSIVTKLSDNIEKIKNEII